jgi:rsbT co-antagonist protein RsbR
MADNDKGFADLWAVYDGEYDRINDALIEAVKDNAQLAALLASMTEQQIFEQRRAGRERFRLAVESGDWGTYFEHTRGEGATYARSGLDFSAWTPLVFAFRDLLGGSLLEAYGDDAERQRGALSALNTWADLAFTVLAEAYLETKEEIIREQNLAIRELATPILSVREGLLILPLIGVIDSRRAADITESLLTAIVEHRSKAVVIDITGVPAVDSMVANHLIQTAEAARLMGAHVLVSGVSTANAQTLVRIGVDPRRLNTVGDLQSAIEHAERVLADPADGADG